MGEVLVILSDSDKNTCKVIMDVKNAHCINHTHSKKVGSLTSHCKMLVTGAEKYYAER